MKTVNMHEAKTQLSRLVAKAESGEPFLIARAGEPVVQVSALERPEKHLREFGFASADLRNFSGSVDAYFDPELEREVTALFENEDPLLNASLDRIAHAKPTSRTKPA